VACDTGWAQPCCLLSSSFGSKCYVQPGSVVANCWADMIVWATYSLCSMVGLALSKWTQPEALWSAVGHLHSLQCSDVCTHGLLGMWFWACHFFFCRCDVGILAACCKMAWAGGAPCSVLMLLFVSPVSHGSLLWTAAARLHCNSHAPLQSPSGVVSCCITVVTQQFVRVTLLHLV